MVKDNPSPPTALASEAGHCKATGIAVRPATGQGYLDARNVMLKGLNLGTVTVTKLTFFPLSSLPPLFHDSPLTTLSAILHQV